MKELGAFKRRVLSVFISLDFEFFGYVGYVLYELNFIVDGIYYYG